MLHASLRALEEAAPDCRSAAQARGVLAESHELLRNALAHSDDESELVHWYSRVLAAVLASPAVAEIAGAVRLVPLGALARREVLPDSPLRFAAVLDDAASAGAGAKEAVGRVVALFADAEVPAEAGGEPVTEAERAARLEAALEQADMATVADAADSALAEGETLDERSWAPLAACFEAARPVGLRVRDGLPDRSVTVDVERDLVEPVAAVARWAANSAGTPSMTTSGRLAVAADRGVLSPAEAEELELAWRTGVRIRLRRWDERVSTRPVPAEDLSAVQRSAYGASARGLATVIDAVAARVEGEAGDPAGDPAAPA